MAGGFAVMMHLNVYFTLTDYAPDQFCICTVERDVAGLSSVGQSDCSFSLMTLK